MQAAPRWALAPPPRLKLADLRWTEIFRQAVAKNEDFAKEESTLRIELSAESNPGRVNFELCGERGGSGP